MQLDGSKPLVLFPPLQVSSTSFTSLNRVLFPPLQSPWSFVTQGPFRTRYITASFRHSNRLMMSGNTFGNAHTVCCSRLFMLDLTFNITFGTHRVYLTYQR